MEGLRRRRREAGLTQTELAELAATTQVTISEIEQGKREARPSTLRRLARALGVEVADLFLDDPKAPAPQSWQERLQALDPAAARRLLRGHDEWSVGAIQESRAVAGKLGISREELMNLLVEVRPQEAHEILVGHDKQPEVEGEALLLYEQALHEAADLQLIDIHEMFKRRETFQKVA